MKRLMVGTPAYGGQLTSSYFRSVLNLDRLLTQSGYQCCFVVLDGISVLPVARNLIVHEFLKSDCDGLLFVDADLGFRADDVIKMFQYTDADVIAGLYPKKELNFVAISEAGRVEDGLDAMKAWGRYSGMFQTAKDINKIDIQYPFEVNYAPTGLMLINRHCLNRLAPATPIVMSAIGQKKGSEPRKLRVFFDNSISDSGYYHGEDFTFCKKVTDSGGKILGCPWFVTRHVGMTEYVGDLHALGNLGLGLD